MGTRLTEKLITFLVDFLAVNAAFAAAFFLRYHSGLFLSTYDPSLNLLDWRDPMLILSGAWLILFFFTGLYRDWYKEGRIDEFLVVCRTVAIGAGLLFLLISADEIIQFVKTGAIPRLFTRTQFAVLSTYSACMLFFAALNRVVMHTLLAWFFSRGLFVQKLAIVGADDSADAIIHAVRTHPQLGYEVAGFIDVDTAKKGMTIAGYPVFGTWDDLGSIIERERLSGLIISRVTTSADDIMTILGRCADHRITIYMVPSLLDVVSGQYKTQAIFGVPLVVLLRDHLPSWQAQIKRLMDIAASLMVLLLGFPIWLFIAFLVKVTSKGPVVFRQERVGQNGRPFTMLKFRSMFEDAESRTGPVWATERDPRVTPLGRFLRTTRLDEIPQFVNVLRGDMSLVGPRPERAYFIEQLREQIPWYIRRIKMKPGITGWAQINHKYDQTVADVRQKVLYDLYYFDNLSIMLDITILLRTILVVVTGRGAH